MPRKSTLRIISMVQARVDAFLKEIFDICESSEDSPTAKSLSDTIATKIAIYDTVETAIRRRRNERILFSRLSTDIVHSIFGIVLDVDRIHDPDLPSHALEDYRHQLERMRLVSSAWNNFLLSSPRYWQAIDVTRSAKAITSVIKRSGSAPLCIYSFAGFGGAGSFIPLVPAARVQTLRSNEVEAYPLYRQFLQNPMPALQTLEIRAQPQMRDDPSGPLGNLPSIRHLRSQWWQPGADAAWLTNLKELVLWRTWEPNMELLRVLSACANLEQLEIFSTDEMVLEELPGAISPITLPRLQSIRLRFESNRSMAKLIRRLVAPKCLRRTIHVEKALDLGLYVADYRRFMSVERCIGQHPKSAAVFLSENPWVGTQLYYKTESCQVSLRGPSVEEGIPAVHDLVQELQTLFNEPPLMATVHYPSEQTWLWLESLGDQNIQTIVAHLTHKSSNGDFLKTIGARPNLPSLDTPVANSATDWPFKSLRSIEIHDTHMNLVDFIGLVEEYLDKESKPSLEEIALVRCSLEGMESNQAVERLDKIGITLRLGLADEAEASSSDYSGTSATSISS